MRTEKVLKWGLANSQEGVKKGYLGPRGALKYNVVSRRDQGFLKYTLKKYFLLKPKYTLCTDFTRFLTNFTPKRVMQANIH